MVHEMREIWYWKCCSTFEVSLKSKYALNQLEISMGYQLGMLLSETQLFL